MSTIAEYQQRRATLMRSVEAGTALLIPSAVQLHRTKSSEYPYRQGSDFYYLTGFNEPESLLVLLPGEQESCILFCQPKNPDKERWQGTVLGLEGAIQQLAVDRTLSIHDMDKYLPQMLKSKEVYCLQDNRLFLNRLHEWLGDVSIHPLEPKIASLRKVKSPSEIATIRQAVNISVEAHKRGMKTVKPGMYEYQLAAEYEYVFRHAGADCPAYESIVGGGKNACILHYRTNRDILKDGTLVLVDAAAEFQNYAADITRTYPVNGRFSPQQRDVYELVLNAQLSAIAMMKPGVDWETLQNACVKVLSQGLIDLKIIQGTLDEVIDSKKYRDFYMHSSGHWLGLDVHDVGTYKVDEKPVLFEPNMVMTMEPGLYIDENPAVDPQWWGIGVRIEDDIVITDLGCEVLSQGCPKTVADLESFMAG